MEKTISNKDILNAAVDRGEFRKVAYTMEDTIPEWLFDPMSAEEK